MDRETGELLPIWAVSNCTQSDCIGNPGFAAYWTPHPWTYKYELIEATEIKYCPFCGKEVVVP